MRRWLYCTALGLSLMVPAAALPLPAVAAEAPVRGPAYIVVKAFQLKSVARLSFAFDRLADPKLVPIPRGVELHLDADVPFRLNGLPQLKQIESVEERAEDGKRIVTVRFTCDCTVQTSRSGKSYRLDIHESAASTVAAQPPAAPVAVAPPAAVAATPVAMPVVAPSVAAAPVVASPVVVPPVVVPPVVVPPVVVPPVVATPVAAARTVSVIRRGKRTPLEG